jgi:hypothetical protein
LMAQRDSRRAVMAFIPLVGHRLHSPGADDCMRARRQRRSRSAVAAREAGRLDGRV